MAGAQGDRTGIDVLKFAGALATLAGAGAAIGAVLCTCARAVLGKNDYTQFDDWMGHGATYGVVLGTTLILTGIIPY